MCLIPSFDKSISEYKKLPHKKRAQVLRYIEIMEGSWGDLAYASEREQHYFIIEAICPTTSAFPAALEEDMEARWKTAESCTCPDPFADLPKEVRMARTKYNMDMFNAESAFRDFHYEFNWAEQEMEK